MPSDEQDRVLELPREPASEPPARRRAMILIGPGEHFGVELVVKFASEGFEIAIVSAQRSSLDRLSHHLRELGQRIKYVQGDVAHPTRFRQILDALVSEIAPVECVIYNPKVSVAGSGLSTTPTELSASMAVNVTGAMISIQALLPALARADQPRVILTGGGYKDRPDPQKFALAVGKAGLHGLAKAMRAPLSARGIALKTIVIDGAVRRGAIRASSESIADFYWRVFADCGNFAYRFPEKVVSETAQLSLAM